MLRVLVRKPSNLLVLLFGQRLLCRFPLALVSFACAADMPCSRPTDQREQWQPPLMAAVHQMDAEAEAAQPLSEC